MKKNKVKNLLVVCSLCAIILIVSTYAWFIGMKTVSVSAFEVSIAAIDGLSLSLDGKVFQDTVTINKHNYNNPETVGKDNTNIWGDLIPLSTVGDIDPKSSRLKFFEKGSLTATNGGYRLMASRVKNNETKNKNGEYLEGNGYVAFDLYIKNQSGKAYYKDLNRLNEEAIYLVPESEVKSADAGNKQDKTGIENSVRVAFAQIGRVVGNYESTDGNDAKIRQINCNSNGDVTPICMDRRAVIWEPNDKKHVNNALSWYTTACRPRTGDDVSIKESYNSLETCIALSDNQYLPTYSVNDVIDWKDNVDVYDGIYNGYTKTVKDSKDSLVEHAKIEQLDTFTDTEKNFSGIKRQEFMSLAPNSITKIRIYIYIEGQDVDNYDFAQLGKKISVLFGFTKERFYGEDIDYDGPQLPDDVIKFKTVSYDNKGEFIEPTDERVIFDDNKNEFTIPRWFTKFAFRSNGKNKVATYKIDHWEFN